MKKIYTFNKRLVQGDEHEITKDEIMVVTQPDGSVDLQERDLNGKFNSLVKGGDVADESQPLYTFDKIPKKVKAAIEHFIDVGTEEGYVESRIYMQEVDIIREVLPEAKDVHYTPCNLVGYVGCKLNDGFELATLDWYIKVVPETASLTVYKFDSTN